MKNPKLAAVDSHGISKLNDQKLSQILKVKTSFKSQCKAETIYSGVTVASSFVQFTRLKRLESKNDRPSLTDIKYVLLNGKILIYFTV